MWDKQEVRSEGEVGSQAQASGIGADVGSNDQMKTKDKIKRC